MPRSLRVLDGSGRRLVRRTAPHEVLAEGGFAFVQKRRRVAIGLRAEDGTRFLRLNEADAHARVPVAVFSERNELRLLARTTGTPGRLRVTLNDRILAELSVSDTDWSVAGAPVEVPRGKQVLTLSLLAGDALEVAWVELEHAGPAFLVTEKGAGPLTAEYDELAVEDGALASTLAQLADEQTLLAQDDSPFGLAFRRASIRGDRRVSFWLPAPSRLETHARLAEGDLLRFAVGSPEEPDATDVERMAPGTRVTYRVLWERGRREQVVLDEVVVTGDARWTNREVRVDASRAGDGVLCFETSAPVRTTPAAFADPRIVRAASDAPPPNVLVYVVDSLRADHLSCYGARNPTSPRIDGLARDGFRFEAFGAVAPRTGPATASLLTGYFPNWHGVGRSLPLPPSLRTLAEALAGAGYSTWAAVSSPEIGGSQLGFDQGFHRFVDHEGVESALAGVEAASSTRVNATVLPWLDRVSPEPLLLYVHALDPRAPRELEALGNSLAAEDRAMVENAYDDQIRHLDRELGLLLDGLDRRGLLENTVVLVLSDHGVELFEHGGSGHGYRMWEELLHVPLIVWVPPPLRVRWDLVGRAIDAPVSQVDFLPGLLELIGVEDDFPRQGRSWRPFLDGESATLRPFVGVDYRTREGGEVGAYRSAQYKLLWNASAASTRERVFDLERDPGERRDLASDHPELLGRLRMERDALLVTLLEVSERLAEAGLEHVVPAPADAEPLELDANLLRALRSLGY